MITKKDTRWVQVATKMLRFSSHKKYLMAAIVIKGNRLLSIGINKDSAPKRFFKQHRPKLALHCEIDALLGLPKKVSKDATIYVVGKTKSGQKILSKPCLTCESAIDKMGLKRVIYWDKQGVLHEC